MSYISLGNGISYRENKNNTYTYYCSYRENKKVKRKKLFAVNELSNKNYKKALLQSQNITDLKNEEEQIITVDFLSYKYYEARRNTIIGKMRRKYNHLNHLSIEEFSQMRNIKNKLQGIRGAETTYIKNIRHTKIAKMNLKDITKQDIKDLLDKDLNLKGLSQKTVFNIISQVKTIVNFGIDNNCNTINPFRRFNIKNPKKKRERYLDIEELELLLKTARKHTNANVYLSIYLGVLTAGRATTVLNIQKKDIDFKNNIIKLDNFKSDKLYSIKISEKGSNWLKKITQHLENEDYLIRAKKPRGQAFKAVPRGVFKIMDDLFNQGLDKQNNLDRDKVVNFHTLRRSIATNLALQKVDIYKIMTLLCHTTPGQTKDYLNLSGIAMTDEIETLNNEIFKNF